MLINLELCHHAVLQAIFTEGELDGCSLAPLAYEIKTSENLFYWGGGGVVLARYTKICTNENFLLYGICSSMQYHWLCIRLMYDVCMYVCTYASSIKSRNFGAETKSK